MDRLPLNQSTDDGAEASRLIDAVGGTSEAARICEVSPQAVTQWRKAGIPRARLMFLRLRFPQLFDDGAPQREAA